MGMPDVEELDAGVLSIALVTIAQPVTEVETLVPRAKHSTTYDMPHYEEGSLMKSQIPTKPHPISSKQGYGVLDIHIDNTCRGENCILMMNSWVFTAGKLSVANLEHQGMGESIRQHVLKSSTMMGGNTTEQSQLGLSELLLPVGVAARSSCFGSTMIPGVREGEREERNASTRRRLPKLVQRRRFLRAPSRKEHATCHSCRTSTVPGARKGYIGARHWCTGIEERACGRWICMKCMGDKLTAFTCCFCFDTADCPCKE